MKFCNICKGSSLEQARQREDENFLKNKVGIGELYEQQLDDSEKSL